MTTQPTAEQPTSPVLPAWRDGRTRQAILDFVAATTTPDSPDFVPPEARIAVFDNDGTLWCEKPMYIQLAYILRTMAQKATDDPALRTKQPWQAAWARDFGWFGDAMTKHYQGDDADLHVLLGGVLALAQDQPVEQVEAAAKAFVAQQRHPTLDRLYQECIYPPMVELLRYLEAHGFTNYIVSGGGRDFMRGFAQELYGIPRRRTIGTTVAYHYVENDEGNHIAQHAELDLIDDGPNKPVQIWNVIGQRPILAAGNSNGDIEMLKFTQGNDHATLNLLIYHDDNTREFAYDQGAERALELAQARNWQVVSMRDDWTTVFPPAASS